MIKYLALLTVIFIAGGLPSIPLQRRSVFGIHMQRVAQRTPLWMLRNKEKLKSKKISRPVSQAVFPMGETALRIFLHPYPITDQSVAMYNKRVKKRSKAIVEQTGRRSPSTMPIFEGIPGGDMDLSNAIFIYNDTKGERIINSMLSAQRYPMQEPVPGQVLYPPSAPVFRLKPRIEPKPHKKKIAKSNAKASFTYIPFYAHEAIPVPFNIIRNYRQINSAAVNHTVTDKTKSATEAKPIKANDGLTNANTPKVISRYNGLKKANHYHAYHDQRHVHWLPHQASMMHHHDRTPSKNVKDTVKETAESKTTNDNLHNGTIATIDFKNVINPIADELENILRSFDNTVEKLDFHTHEDKHYKPLEKEHDYKNDDKVVLNYNQRPPGDYYKIIYLNPDDKEPEHDMYGFTDDIDEYDFPMFDPEIDSMDMKYMPNANINDFFRTNEADDEDMELMNKYYDNKKLADELEDIEKDLLKQQEQYDNSGTWFILNSRGRHHLKTHNDKDNDDKNQEHYYSSKYIEDTHGAIAPIPFH